MSWVAGGFTPVLRSQAFRVFSRHCWAAHPQLASSTSGSRSRRAIFRSRRAILSRRAASGLAIEQHAVAEGLMHDRAGLLSANAGFTAGVEHQVDLQIGLGQGTPQLSQQGKAVALGQPGIRCGN